jgi:hypothetical protein
MLVRHHQEHANQILFPGIAYLFDSRSPPVQSN